MADIKDIVKVAVDARKGRVEKYSVAQSQELIRQALIEANNGSTTLNYKDIRDGKCQGLFAIVEELLSATVVDGIQEDDFFMAMVDFRNVKLGDKNLFRVKDSNLYVVAEAADGTMGIRRQRLAGATDVEIETSLKVVRIYEELNRILSGRVDWNEMVDLVGQSFKNQLLNEVYGLWDNVTAEQIGGAVYFPVAGTYDEDALLDVIAHVEAAANGQSATIIGTKKAIRSLVPSIKGNLYENDMFNYGYAGKFYGSPVVVVPQRHQVGSTEFVLDDNVITIIAGDQKPIKVVYEGESFMHFVDPFSNADLTQECYFAEKYGIGLVTASDNGGIGRYEMTD